MGHYCLKTQESKLFGLHWHRHIWLCWLLLQVYQCHACTSRPLAVLIVLNCITSSPGSKTTRTEAGQSLKYNVENSLCQLSVTPVPLLFSSGAGMWILAVPGRNAEGEKKKKERFCWEDYRSVTLAQKHLLCNSWMRLWRWCYKHYCFHYSKIAQKLRSILTKHWLDATEPLLHEQVRHLLPCSHTQPWLYWVMPLQLWTSCKQYPLQDL